MENSILRSGLGFGTERANYTRVNYLAVFYD
jgi:hypothetical protein